MTDDELLDLLQTLIFELKSAMSRAMLEQGDALAPMEMRALAFFAKRPLSSPSDLVKRTGRDKAQVARLIASLVDRGLLTSQTDAEDRRSYTLKLTKAGVLAARRIERKRRRAAENLFAGFDERERAGLASFLTRMQQNL